MLRADSRNRIFLAAAITLAALLLRAHNLDWGFPVYFPNPSVVEMMEDTGEKVIETGADMGVAIDGDGDRLGITDEQGQVVWPDRILILLSR